MSLRFGTPKEAGMSEIKLKNLEELSEQWVQKRFVHSLVYMVARMRSGKLLNGSRAINPRKKQISTYLFSVDPKPFFYHPEE